MARQEAKRRLGIPLDRTTIMMISANLSQAHKGIAKGLQADETVVVDGAGKLTEGAPVKVTGQAPLAAVGEGSRPASATGASAPASAPSSKP